jgi:hypothetical protein
MILCNVDEKRHSPLFGQASHFLPGLLPGSISEQLWRRRSWIGVIVYSGGSQMPRRPESRGTCLFCGETIVKRSVSKHLAKCPKRLESIQAADVSARPEETLWHLRIQGAYAKEYWLDLEMKGAASLEQLDNYLRATWLECCDHLSQFTIGGWGGTDIGKARKANSVFEAGLVLRHLYDFGTTSETDIQVMGSRSGHPLTKHPIYLMARNNQPEVLCEECGQPAEWLCIECLNDYDKTGF